MREPRTTNEEETVNASGSDDDLLLLRVILGDRAFSTALPTEGELILGRASDASVVVDHPSVSRSHARLRIGPSQLVVEDLGGVNGTRLAGKALTSGQATPVRIGEAIELGDVVCVIQRGRAARTAAQPAGGLELGRSAAMLEVARVIDRVAPGMISVVVIGETGAGKEVISDAIVRRSRRANKPFVRLNCAAVAEQLLESEWFGHERGAFTGALAAKPGLLETADGGTVLLDEVGELPLNLQAKLLRVVEERAMMRVGGVKPRRIDVRFLAATNRDLEAEVARGAFRQDLYFRLNGVTIHVPPLRDRREEIEPLARTFIVEASEQAGRPPLAIDPQAIAWLLAHPWPGNVRELRNMMERAVLLAAGDTLTLRDLESRAVSGARSDPASSAEPMPSSRGSLRDAVADVERQRVIDALAEANGNQKRAAELLGISRGTLIARLDTFGIARPRKG